VGDRSKHDREGAGERPTPALAETDAARRIGHGFRSRVAESIDSTGKALAVLAGFGVFFIGAGYIVEWQRFRQGKLPSEQVLPLVPKDQIAAAGARELAISVLFVGVSLAMLGFVLVRLARWTQGRPGRFARALNRMLAGDVAFPTAIVGVLTVLIVPRDGTGFVVAAIVTGLFLYGLLLVRDFLETGDHGRFPLWRLVLAVGVAAIVLSGARQFEFPEPRPDALVCLTDGTEFEGDYIASDSQKVLLRQRSLSSHQRGQLERVEGRLAVANRELKEARDALAKTVRQDPRPFVRHRHEVKAEADTLRSREPKRHDGLECADRRSDRMPKTMRRRHKLKRPQFVVVPSSAVEEIVLTRSRQVLPYNDSLLDSVLSIVPGLSEIELACIPPECRLGSDTRIGPSTYL
jgi:hypothetical protein